MKFAWPRLIGPALSTLVAIGCATGNDQVCSPLAPCPGDGDGGEGGGGPPPPTYVGAKGISIDKIVLYQGVERPLIVAGAPVQSTVPIVAGRDAIVRVFYTVDPAVYNNAPVVGTFVIDGQVPVVVNGTLFGKSVDDNMASTLNFAVPGASIAGSLSWVARIDQEGKPADDNVAARFPADGFSITQTNGSGNVLRITLVPFQYQADGSNRLPDTSPAMVEKYRARLKALYPVSDVQITVHAPFPYAQAIDAGGFGWGEALDATLQLRQQESAPNDVYYYGIFAGADSFGQFCGGGCVTGLAPLNGGGGSGAPDQRGGMGIGFDPFAQDTAAHELGHAHGRQHADCGGADGIDPGYPSDAAHQGAKIGVWGLDVATQMLVNPTRTDIMGYCDNQWISDYNFAAMFERSRAVNQPDFHGEPRKVAVVLVDGAGNAKIRRTVTETVRASGKAVPARIHDGAGNPRAVEATFVPFDHLPGGFLRVPYDGDVVPTRISFDLDGRTRVAEK